MSRLLLATGLIGILAIQGLAAQDEKLTKEKAESLKVSAAFTNLSI